MLETLKQQGFLRTTIYNGINYYTVSPGCTFRITKRVLSVLQSNYKPNAEIGGILGFLPVKNEKDYNFICDNVEIIANGQPSQKQKNSYLFDPKTFNRSINDKVKNGMLPVKFHSHPVSIGDRNYDNRLIDFFSKTSITDRHSSYIPYRVSGDLLIMPDGLLAPENREGTETRFYLYNGFITPLSIRALVQKERNFLVIALSILASLYFAGFKKAFYSSIAAAFAVGFVIFTREAALRPKITKDERGDLLIFIPKI